jgi:hypothetical protein
LKALAHYCSERKFQRANAITKTLTDFSVARSATTDGEVEVA